MLLQRLMSTFWGGLVIGIILGSYVAFLLWFIVSRDDADVGVPSIPSTPTATSYPTSSSIPTGIPTRSPSSRPTGSASSSGTPDPGRGELEDFLRECKTATKFREGQVSFPDEMEIGVGESSSYSAVVDVRTEPAPAETVIDAPKPRSDRVKVKCILSARLVPVGDGMEVKPPTDADEGGWRTLTFTPDGLVEWTWTVKALVPEDQSLRLELLPAVEVQGRVGDPVRSSVSYVTRVKVKATALDKVGQWFDTQGKVLRGIGVAIGAIILGVLAFSSQLREAVAKLFKRKPAEDAAPPPPTAPAEKPKRKNAKKKH